MRDGPMPAGPVRHGRPLGALELLKTALRDVTQIYDEELFSEPLVRRRYLGFPVWYVSDPALIRRILVEAPRDYPGLPAIRRLYALDLDTGSIASEGDTWQRHRRASTPALDPRSMRDEIRPLADLSAGFCDGFAVPPAGEAVDIQPHLTAFSRQLFNQVLSGNDPDFMPVHDWLTRVPGRPGLFDIIPTTPWIARLLRPKRWGEDKIALDRRLRAHLEARRDPDWAGGRDFLWRLANGPGAADLTHDEVRNEASSIIAGGASTIARGLTWCLYLLALHPDAQARMRAEIAEVLGDDLLALETLPRLAYSRRVIDETLRLYPAIPVLARQAARTHRLDGYRLWRGTIILLPPLVVQRHRSLWDDPDRFEPDRFLPERSAKRPKMAYFPFSAGPRICVGATVAIYAMQAFLTTFLRRFEIALAPDQNTVLSGTGITLKMRHGLRLFVTPRLAAPVA